MAGMMQEPVNLLGVGSCPGTAAVDTPDTMLAYSRHTTLSFTLYAAALRMQSMLGVRLHKGYTSSPRLL